MLRAGGLVSGWSCDGESGELRTQKLSWGVSTSTHPCTVSYVLGRGGGGCRPLLLLCRRHLEKELTGDPLPPSTRGPPLSFCLPTLSLPAGAPSWKVSGSPHSGVRGPQPRDWGVGQLWELVTVALWRSLWFVLALEERRGGGSSPGAPRLSRNAHQHFACHFAPKIPYPSYPRSSYDEPLGSTSLPGTETLQPGSKFSLPVCPPPLQLAAISLRGGSLYLGIQIVVITATS